LDNASRQKHQKIEQEPEPDHDRRRSTRDRDSPVKFCPYDFADRLDLTMLLPFHDISPRTISPPKKDASEKARQPSVIILMTKASIRYLFNHP
jgi:hypothetical protein